MKNENEIFICKIKECSMLFLSCILAAAEEHLKEHHPGYEGQIRNASDGCYELFGILKTDKLKANHRP
jgi:hypothetical protein